MPWSNQNGGGPWGGGGGNNQGPWGQGPRGPQGNGPQPDLDEFIKRSQDQMKRFLPGGANGGVFVIGAVILVVFWLFQSIYTVQPDERGVELLFGKPKNEVSEPGLHFHFWPVETVEMVNITEQQQNIGATSGNADSGLMLTGDQNIVNVQFSVLYAVTDPAAYLFKVEAPQDTLRQVAESAMREVVGSRPAQDIYRDNRQAVADDVKNTIQATLDQYQAGISVTTVSIEDAAPPREVADAFDEVQRAEQDEDRFVEEANRYANQKLGRARGEAAQIGEEAAAYKDRVVKEAQGEAQRFDDIYAEYIKAPEVTRKRMYLETMEGVLKDTKKVISDEASGTGTVPYLSLNELLKRNETTTTTGGNN
ncbi:FtsH protease activity modulator HflK [Rhizobium sp. L1K21]|uniref:FtsH protease activity modulator HflK n=1 Tax=Rhizobium sp. L1K21 TaxID=2954933 RepID=UPI002092EFC2|nr:FtsH protease activity modulator HflK [Rhizobium sp. L1K21]MCO6185703.1 FtsH protease activity modulator HflK [Rhizobium sp. L1K21]